ncbi:CD8A protein, partial [Trogon melanurus]|nr:CD8A protein [Trogon melanurus]
QLWTRFRDGSTKHPQLGQRLELECVITKEDRGISWVHQDKGGTLHFIVHISSTSQTTFEGIKRTSTRFEARKHRRGIYRLIVKSFTSQDEGNYFCIVNCNQMLSFSRGQPSFFPGSLPPPNIVKTSAASTWWTFLFSFPADTSKEKHLRIFCDILWVPLVGACLLLLLAQAVTVMLCQ